MSAGQDDDGRVESVPDDVRVWVASGSSSSTNDGKRFHTTDDGCPYAKRARNLRQLPPGQTPIRSSLCGYCAEHDDTLD